MQTNQLRRMVSAALFATLCFCSTFLLKIPFVNGYIHLGDCFCLLSGWLLGPLYGPISAGLGSMLADLAAGYPVYLPATFLIKAAMALIVALLCRKNKAPLLCHVLATLLAEAVMVVGYFLYELVLYGIGGALPAVTGNLLQAAGGIVTSLLLWQVLAPIFKKYGFKF